MDGLGGVGAGGDVARDGDSVEVFEEVEVEPGPPELAVGDGPHADRLELGDRIRDRHVLDPAQLGSRDLVVGAICWRAASTAGGRSRLPTWSARKGGSIGLMRA